MSEPELCGVPLWTEAASIQDPPSGFCGLPKYHNGDHVPKDKLTELCDPGETWKPIRDLPPYYSQDDAF